MKNQTFEQHPLSSFFHDLSKSEFKSLKDSISKNGVLNPIIIHEDMILDGWHRYKVCQELGIKCPFVNYNDVHKDIPVKLFVILKNKERKDLTKSQLTFAITQVSEWVPCGIKSSDLEKEFPQRRFSLKNHEIAKLSDSSMRTIQRAKQVFQNGSDELKEAVKQGKLSLRYAAEISKLPIKEQASAISIHIGRTKRSNGDLSLLSNEEQAFTKQGKTYRIHIRELWIDIIFKERKNQKSKRKKRALNRPSLLRGSKSSQKTP